MKSSNNTLAQSGPGLGLAEQSAGKTPLPQDFICIDPEAAKDDLHLSLCLCCQEKKSGKDEIKPSLSKDFIRGVQCAAMIARDEFARSPNASQGHDSVWMDGYESACDHLSIEILKLIDRSAPLPDLEWAAQWIEGSLLGETNDRVIEFARNMAMTFRAASEDNALRRFLQP